EWVEDADFGQPSITALLRYYGARIGAVIFIFSLTIIALLQAWRARGAISEIAKQRAAFLSIMAHEIRNPLNYILASIELAYVQPDKSAARHYIEIAINGGKSLSSLLSTVLDYSKISDTNISIDKSATTISEILSPILPGFHIEAEQKGLRFEAPASNYFDQPLLLDVVKIRQILTNIVSNAIKFTDHGSVSLFIESKMDFSPGRITFRVADTGIGIPSREIPNITKPFYQIKNKSKKEIGAGLGLAICSTIINAMHGDLSVTSSPGQGTVVTVSIPCERTIRDSSQGEDCTAAGNNANMNVLVVEDIEINREIIRDQLEHLGYSTATVGSGWEAVSELNQKTFDLVLLDCNLPDMSGYDVAKHIRSSNRTEISSTPIIAISADVDAEHVGRCFDSGMDGVIPKPISLSKLKETLRAWSKKDINAYKSTAPKLSNVSDEEVLAGLREEALHVLKSAEKMDGDKVEYYIHRFRGIALSFDLAEYVNMANIEISESGDFRVVCATMINIIRSLDNEISSIKR
ncbi:response regulator, partial [Burkholderia multivorans]|nr:response regulator [Burkholderia multivorans]